ncbi:MAG: hypothetical protein RLZ12_677 [Bacillota bacterium]
MRKFTRLLFISIVTFCLLGLKRVTEERVVQPSIKDVVLIHGFSNRHEWGEEFLAALAKRVRRLIVVYISEEEGKVRERLVRGQKVFYIGRNTYRAGIQSIKRQGELIGKRLDKLKSEGIVSAGYYLVGHSTGGVLARKVVYERPNEVAGVVAIAAPHQGTPLIQDYAWLARVMVASTLPAEFTPQAMSTFNQRYPAIGSPFYTEQGKVCTITGKAQSWLSRGWNGEVAAGKAFLRLKYGTASDGVVPEKAALLYGAKNIATFKRLDHLELIESEQVAQAVTSAIAG